MWTNYFISYRTTKEDPRKLEIFKGISEMLGIQSECTTGYTK